MKSVLLAGGLGTRLNEETKLSSLVDFMNSNCNNYMSEQKTIKNGVSDNMEII